MKKADWSLTREEWYHEECNKILYDKEVDLMIEDDEVYLKSADKNTLLVRITKSKTMWYEIWLKLKDN